jgi:hypothetical protein
MRPTGNIVLTAKHQERKSEPGFAGWVGWTGLFVKHKTLSGPPDTERLRPAPALGVIPAQAGICWLVSPLPKIRLYHIGIVRRSTLG